LRAACEHAIQRSTAQNSSPSNSQLTDSAGPHEKCWAHAANGGWGGVTKRRTAHEWLDAREASEQRTAHRRLELVARAHHLRATRAAMRVHSPRTSLSPVRTERSSMRKERTQGTCSAT